jgi:hypothetical protein
MLPAKKMRSLFGWNTQSGHAPLVKTPAGTAVELDVVVTIARTNFTAGRTTNIPW